MRIALASDHAAVEVRLHLAEWLCERGCEAVDLGCEPGQRVDYPDYAEAVARAVVTGDVARGVLICGTGIGMSIAANKVAGIRAALVHDVTTARLAAAHNHANILCLGGRVLGIVTMEEILAAWLETGFEARHQGRLDKVTALEQSN
jgi:ribose 5-phosphate isomerase B